MTEKLDCVKKRKLRLPAAVAGLLLLLVFTVIVALMFGSVGPIGGTGTEKMSFQAFIDIITGNGDKWQYFQAAIIESRLPRVLLALLVGCALSSSGTTMQAMFRNPMADPFIIGISSGAAVGAAVAVFLPMAIFQSAYVLPILAFLGATLTVFSVYAIARSAGGRLRVETLLLTGIAVGSFLSALTALMMYISGRQFNYLFYWILGGLTAASWTVVIIVAIPTISGLVFLQFFSRDLNAMTLGEEPAMHLGVDVETLKKILLVVVAMLAGVAVAFSGIIGFVGLIIPHMVRLAVGPDHRILLPLSTIAGGIFLVWADTVARIVMQPTEIPLGIITALCGAPFFIYLLVRNKK
jgi:iron complex transport system permease protein